MTSVTRLANHLLLVISIAHHTHGGPAIGFHAANFSGGQLDLCVILVTRHHGGRGAGRADDLATLALSQLDIVNRGARGNLASGKALPDSGSASGPL